MFIAWVLAVGSAAGEPTSTEIEDPWAIAAIAMVFVAVFGWALLGKRLRKDYRRADQARLLAVVCLAALLAASVLAIVAAAWYVLIFTAAFGAFLVRDVYEQRANRAVADRMAELRAESPTSSAPTPERTAPPGVAPMGPLPIERIDAASGLRGVASVAWSKGFEAWSAARREGQGIAQALAAGVRQMVQTAPAVPNRVAPLPSGDPVRVTVLWVFEEELQRDVVDLAKRLGPVTFLRGGGVVADGHIRAILAGKVDEIIDATADEVQARVGTFDWSVGAENSMLCADAVWKVALDEVLARTDLVVMDVSTFSSHNLGCAHEFGAVLDRLPASRFLLITGRRTDHTALQTALERAWSTLAVASPNRAGATGAIRLVTCRHLDDGDPKHGDAVPAGGTPKQREVASLDRLLAAAIGRAG